MTDKISAMPISDDFISHIRRIYDLSLPSMLSWESAKTTMKLAPTKREGINVLTDWGPVVYVLAVAAVEAFLGEMYSNPLNKEYFAGTRIYELTPNEIKKMSILKKLYDLPLLASERTFKKDEQPYADMELLIKVRNAIVHYGMTDEAPTFLKTLRDRGYALTWSNLPWTFAISTTEGLRWAHNTACGTIRCLFDFLPDKFPPFLQNVRESYLPISDQQVQQWFADNNRPLAKVITVP